MYQGGVPKVSEAQEVGAGDKDCHAHGRVYAIALFNAKPRGAARNQSANGRTFTSLRGSTTNG